MNTQSPVQDSTSQQPSKTIDQPEVAGFVFKTFQLLSVEQYQKIVYWSSNGLEFIIKDVVKFQQIVLPRYFRHKKMNSFVRQLNMYGFHKMKHNNFKSTFKHEYFQKDRQYFMFQNRDLLTLIKRKPKLNDKQNEQMTQEVKVVPQIVKVQKLQPSIVMKQEQPTMAHEKWTNLSQQFLQTTKMINMSLIKVTCNQLSDMVNQIPEEDDCVSIEDQLQMDEEKRQEQGDGMIQYHFEDPACFFASKIFDF